MDRKWYWVTYLYPMRLITLENEQVEFTLEQINSCSYNHGILCRIVGRINSTFKNNEVSYLVCGDGALALLYSDIVDHNDLLLHYNDLLCKLMLGGLAVEAITIKDITTGGMKNENAIWPVNFGRGYNSHMHGLLRMRLTSNTDAIRLLSAAENSITINDFATYLAKGTEIVNSIDNLSTFYLLAGVTDMKYGDWSSALGNLWVVAEQITDFLWEKRFLRDATRNPEIPSRQQTLKNDHRTYSASVKQEILFQVGILTDKVYAKIYGVRKARNKLVHEGILVGEDVAVNLYEAVDELLKIATSNTTANILPAIEADKIY